MPIDERELEQLTGVDSTAIMGDRPCVGCGYNLKGLPVGGRCPECGRNIRRHKPGHRWDDDFVKAPVGWLRLFAAGTNMLFASVLAKLVLFVSLWFVSVSSEIIDLIGIVIAMMWVAAVWLITRPRPVMGSTTVQPKLEWFWLRILSRGAQFCLLGSYVADFFSRMLAGTSPPIELISDVTYYAWYIGMIPTCWLISNYVDWIGDSDRVARWRLYAYLYAGVVVFSLIAALGGLIGGVIGAVFMWLIVPRAAMEVYLYFSQLFSLWALATVSLWALKNRRDADLRQERMRAKAQAELEAEKARKVPKPVR